jgi:RNA polymerase sigma-70 factor (ECF subfamily)
MTLLAGDGPFIGGPMPLRPVVAGADPYRTRLCYRWVGAMAFDPTMRALAEQAAARAGWSIDLDGFIERLRRCIGGEDGPTEPEAVRASALHVDDLYLAHACALGDARARYAFATTHLGAVDEHLRRFRLAPSVVEEVRRKVEDLLLFGEPPDRPPRIGQYSGRGPLRAFVATVAVNASRSWLRQQRRHPDVELDEVTSVLLRPADQSGQAALPRYSEMLRDAMRVALTLLDQRQRTVVRLHVARGVPQTKIAKMLGVNQSTVSRTLDAALHSLQAGIRQRLQQQGVGDDEIASLVRDVRHAIDISLSRILAASEAG